MVPTGNVLESEARVTKEGFLEGTRPEQGFEVCWVCTSRNEKRAFQVRESVKSGSADPKHTKRLFNRPMAQFPHHSKAGRN